MAAFSSSFQHLDASSSSSSSLVFLQNPNSSSSSTSINNMCALFHHPNIALLSHNFHQHNNTTIIINEVKNDTGSSSPINTAAPNKNSMDSSVSQLTPKNNLLLLPLNKKKRKSNPPSSSSPNSAQSKDMREVKGKKQKKVKECKEKKGGEEEETPKDYIHVRARRGQATDSHSLAERVRRERISERMKLLQALVPGCDKVTGKALMLDEIINYVQSLQNQVEFLSMKLACVNPILYDFGMDMESFMVGDQNLVMQECSPTASNAYHGLANNNNNNSVNSLLFHQFQIPQGDRQALWEVDEKIINQSEISNNLFSFPLM